MRKKELTLLVVSQCSLITFTKGIIVYPPAGTLQEMALTEAAKENMLEVCTLPEAELKQNSQVSSLHLPTPYLFFRES